jgi:Flp pilus assembly protein TadG
LSTSHPHTSNQSGQALPEFALVLPLLLLLLLGMLDFGKAFNYWIDSTQITAEGARYAAVNRKPDPLNLLSLQQQLQGQGDTAELRAGGTDSLAAPAQVCIEFPNTTFAAGDPVKVKMTFTYHWLPFLGTQISSLTDTTVSSTATMRLETKATNYVAGCS